MKQIGWLAIAAGAFYAHSRFVFSESHVTRWMNPQDQMAYEGKEKVCDAFRKHIPVSMVSRSPQGRAAPLSKAAWTRSATTRKTPV